MKTLAPADRPAAIAPGAVASAAPIVLLADLPAASPAAADGPAAPPPEDGDSALARARAFAEPLLAGQPLDTGEDALSHADGVAAVLRGIGATPGMQAAAYLVYAGDYLNKPDEVVAKAFGPSYASLVSATRKLVQAQRAARDAQVSGAQGRQQTERVRKMLMAFSRDLRVVLLRLASRLQTLRWHAASKQPCPQALAIETQQVFAPLANRLGIWQIKWELEDLSFRFLQPGPYHEIAALLQEKRSEREAGLESFRQSVEDLLAANGLKAVVQGRPKHIYSIWKKMQGKRLGFEGVLDLRALRVVVGDVAQCYAALARVHERWTPVPGEFDDYIARPKPNGYQSLHTVVVDDGGRPVEVQIRTAPMHEHAEYGVAAHWAYKEAGVRGYAGVSAAGRDEDRIAEARKSVLRQLLAWERDLAQADAAAPEDRAATATATAADADERIYVFTPQATVIELAAGATPVDFAYALHTDLGHRCRGARVDGAMVPLNTPLRNGQTVEITAARDGGPSLDWLNAELGYLASQRSRAKVRAWFNALAQAQTIARGREAVEKLLQRLGRTALKLEELATRLGFRSADQLFEVVGKDEYSLRHIELLLRPDETPAPTDDDVARRCIRPEGSGDPGGVLVVGVESLLTSLARCCRPAPPDAIGGFVTRGKGVAVHRADCVNFRHIAERSPQRVIPVAWGGGKDESTGVYPVDVVVEAGDRSGLLRDITEVFVKEKVNVVGVQSQSVKDSSGGTAWMTFTVEVGDTARLRQVLALVSRVAGVRRARRK